MTTFLLHLRTETNCGVVEANMRYSTEGSFTEEDVRTAKALHVKELKGNWRLAKADPVLCNIMKLDESTDP